MGWRGTVVLLVLIVAAGTWLWLESTPPVTLRPDALSGNQSGREAPPPIEHVLDFDPAAVVGVRLERAGEIRHSEREGGEWHGVENPTLLDDFLHTLSTIGVLSEIPADQAGLEEYGLHPPHSIVELRLRGQQAPLVLQIGDRNPPTTGVYVRAGDNPRVVLAGALVTWEFEKAFKILANAPAGSG